MAIDLPMPLLEPVTRAILSVSWRSIISHDEHEHTNHRVVEPRLSEDEALRRIRDAVLIDQWEERRQRRVERRERRRSQHRDRDLSDIDEIFEGPPRRP
jgi:hypothetical protein